MPLRNALQAMDRMTRPRWWTLPRRAFRRVVNRLRWSWRRHDECSKDPFVVCPSLSKMIRESGKWAEKEKANESAIRKLEAKVNTISFDLKYCQRRLQEAKMTIEAIQRFNQEG